jgi:ribonucleoside-diphosphate reductase alpha chain
LTTITKNKGKRQLPFDKERLINFVDDITKEFPSITAENYKERIVKIIEFENTFRAAEITKKLILNASDNISTEEPDWTYVAARIYLKQLYKEAAYNRSYDEDNKYGDFYGLLKTLGEKGIYSELILKEYTKEEIKQAESFIVPERDKLFTYVGLRTLVERYLAKDHDGRVFELPQERMLIVSMHLMSKEDKNKRMKLVKDAYWALSNMYMTVATPTWANSGKSYGQLSSCFIDTVDDSLQGIYDSNTDVANLSKNSGGIGIYMGKIRSKGSDIKGFKGVSSGVIPWMRQLDNTARSVDQLGTRSGSIVAYLDVWHKDIFAFLDARLNNGDESLRTHKLFLGACIPDLFMEQVEKRGDWYLFDPHEVNTVMGYSLEDYYDEYEGSGSFRDKYNECVQNNNLSKERVPAMDIMKRIMKSQLETGLPYMFYRDEVNRKNPNKHAGMIYSSNLCVEIEQNMSPTTVTNQDTKDGEIVVTKKPGDFVVCNLSSIHLGNAVTDDVLERLIPIQIRMLDNVIDLNTIPVLQAKLTNEKYRGIGLGTFDWAHLLAIKHIKWESQEAVDYADKLYEKINYLAIKASNNLAKEKGKYSVCDGSEWMTGKYFTRRHYGTNEINDSNRLVSNNEWGKLQEDVSENGLRNAWLFAVAPNGSTSLLGNGTATIDPIFSRVYFEEKKNYKIPVVAPDLSPSTMFYYKGAHEIDQLWSIRQNAARQKHIDQSQSFNLYIKNNIRAKDLLNIHMTAWKMKLKTTYYVRSQAIDITECDVCAS